MAIAEKVVVELTAKVDDLERNMRRAGRTVDREVNGIEGTMRGLASKMTAIFGAISTAALVSEFIKLADASKNIDAQLMLASRGFTTFSEAMNSVRTIAAETRSGLAETAALYGNFARASKEMGASEDEAARATETFSKTLKISGAEAAQAASATLQFGQALASGALRGDELNSVLEAAPRLATLLTNSLGKGIGEIKKLGEEGKLTSEVLLNALTNQQFTKGIDEEFKQLPVNFDDAMTQVHNAAVITFGAFDKGGEFSTALANFFLDGSKGFAQMEEDALRAGVAVRSQIEGLASAFEPLFSEAKRFFDFLSGGFQGVDIGRDIQKSLDQIDMVFSKVGGTNFGGRYREAQQRKETELLRRNALTPVSKALNRLSEAASAAPTARPAASSPTSASKPSRSSGASAAAKAAREAEKAIRDEAAKQRESLRLDSEMIAAKAAMVVAENDILAFSLQQLELDKKSRLDDYTTQLKLGRLSQAEYEQRVATVTQIYDLQKKKIDNLVKDNARQDELSRLVAANANEADLLNTQKELSASRIERRDIELRLLDLAYQQEQKELEAIIASSQSTQVAKDIAEERLKILARLKGYEAESINRQSESPLQRRRRELQDQASNINDAVEQVQVDAMDRLGDSIANASQNFIKLGGIAGDVVNGIIQDLVRLAAKQAVMGLFGGSGGIVGSIFGARAAGGSVVGGAGYLVGENGPEIFRPNGSGRIIPNRQLRNMSVGGGGGSVIKQTVNVDARNSVNPQGFAQQILAMSSAQAQQAAATMGQAVNKNIPNRISNFQRDGT